jgi:hypothetical protein
MVNDFSMMANLFVACAFAAVALCAGISLADAVLQRSINTYESDPADDCPPDPGPSISVRSERTSIPRDQNSDLPK